MNPAQRRIELYRVGKDPPKSNVTILKKPFATAFNTFKLRFLYLFSLRLKKRRTDQVRPPTQGMDARKSHRPFPRKGKMRRRALVAGWLDLVERGVNRPGSVEAFLGWMD
jgi:hypothetical protein